MPAEPASTKLTRVAISGAAGRMGRVLVEACQAQAGCELGAAFEQAGHPAIGSDAGLLAGLPAAGVTVASDEDFVAGEFDVLVEFTSPEASLKHLAHCRKLGRKMVIGTTGMDEVARTAVHDAGQDIALVFAPNMSIGVNLCFALLRTAAAALENDYDVEIIEAHHRHKVDSPSGTALRMGEIVAEQLQRNLSETAVFGREGQVGERPAKEIGFATVRGGDIVGDHTVLFAGPGERIEITHKAASRMTFARGAMRAARWLSERSAGIYDMQDVLGLN